MTKTTYATWTRLNHKGPLHDNRRLLRHREKNCECDKCYRELANLPPAKLNKERIANYKVLTYKHKLEEREIKKVQKVKKVATAKESENEKQTTIKTFFRLLDQLVKKGVDNVLKEDRGITLILKIIHQ